MKPSELTIEMMEEMVKMMEDTYLTPQERKIKELENELKKREKRHYKWKVVIEYADPSGYRGIYRIEETDHHVSEFNIDKYILHLIKELNFDDVRNITKIRLVDFVEE